MQYKLSSDVYRAVVLTLLAGVAVLIISLANRDVYAKADVDYRLESMSQLQEARYKYLEERLQDIQEDTRWLVRRLGGESHAASPE